VPSYTALDLRLGWQLSSNVDLSIAAQNLLGSGHGEFTDVATRTDFKRAVFLKLQCRLDATLRTTRFVVSAHHIRYCCGRPLRRAIVSRLHPL